MPSKQRTYIIYTNGQRISVIHDPAIDVADILQSAKTDGFSSVEVPTNKDERGEVSRTFLVNNIQGIERFNVTPPIADEVTIYMNDKPFVVPTTRMSVDYVRGIAGIPYHATLKIALDPPYSDVTVRPSMTFMPSEGKRLYTVP